MERKGGGRGQNINLKNNFLCYYLQRIAHIEHGLPFFDESHLALQKQLSRRNRCCFGGVLGDVEDRPSGGDWIRWAIGRAQLDFAQNLLQIVNSGPGQIDFGPAHFRYGDERPADYGRRRMHPRQLMASSDDSHVFGEDDGEWEERQQAVTGHGLGGLQVFHISWHAAAREGVQFTGQIVAVVEIQSKPELETFAGAWGRSHQLRHVQIDLVKISGRLNQLPCKDRNCSS